MNREHEIIERLKDVEHKIEWLALKLVGERPPSSPNQVVDFMFGREIAKGQGRDTGSMSNEEL